MIDQFNLPCTIPISSAILHHNMYIYKHIIHVRSTSKQTKPTTKQTKQKFTFQIQRKNSSSHSALISFFKLYR